MVGRLCGSDEGWGPGTVNDKRGGPYEWEGHSRNESRRRGERPTRGEFVVKSLRKGTGGLNFTSREYIVWYICIPCKTHNKTATSYT